MLKITRVALPKEQLLKLTAGERSLFLLLGYASNQMNALWKMVISEITRLDDVLESLSRSRGVKILILDACRRNPLDDKLAGMSTTRDFMAGRGLARLDATRGRVVAYSTQADQVALDGTG